MRIIINTTDESLEDAKSSLEAIMARGVFDAEALESTGGSWLNSVSVEIDHGPLTMTVFRFNNVKTP